MDFFKRRQQRSSFRTKDGSPCGQEFTIWVQVFSVGVDRLVAMISASMSNFLSITKELGVIGTIAVRDASSPSIDKPHRFCLYTFDNCKTKIRYHTFLYFNEYL